jgi:hypothetical protein
VSFLFLAPFLPVRESSPSRKAIVLTNRSCCISDRTPSQKRALHFATESLAPLGRLREKHSFPSPTRYAQKTIRICSRINGKRSHMFIGQATVIEILMGASSISLFLALEFFDRRRDWQNSYLRCLYSTTRVSCATNVSSASLSFAREKNMFCSFPRRSYRRERRRN